MRKIPTLFVRDEQDRRHVTSEVTPGCEWVLAGEGVATRKYDGTCCMFDGEQWWARREVKPGKTDPPGFWLISVDGNGRYCRTCGRVDLFRDPALPVPDGGAGDGER